MQRGTEKEVQLEGGTGENGVFGEGGGEAVESGETRVVRANVPEKPALLLFCTRRTSRRDKLWLYDVVWSGGERARRVCGYTVSV